MIVSIHQPAYMPWLGYLDRIAKSDVFVFLDTVQFEKNSYTNRNKIKSANGPLWLTVPVKQQGHIGKPLYEIEIDKQKNWTNKHLKSIENNYRKAPLFSERYFRLQAQYHENDTLLAELCYRQLLFWLEELNINTEVIRSSSMNICGQKSDLVLSICQQLKATQYISGPMGKGYLNEDSFKKASIQLEYQDYKHPEYTQLYGDFIPAMGVVDYWMNCNKIDYFSI